MQVAEEANDVGQDELELKLDTDMKSTPAVGSWQLGTPFNFYPTSPDQYTTEITIWAADLVGFPVGFENSSPVYHKGVKYPYSHPGA